MGIAGGRPNMSLYFVGIENEQLVYLDLHTTRPAMEVKPLKEYSEEVRKKGFVCGNSYGIAAGLGVVSL